jgi:hypothetical protein
MHEMSEVRRIQEITNEFRSDASRAGKGEVYPQQAFFPGPHAQESTYGVLSLLGEIAAQLAEANGLKRRELGEPEAEEENPVEYVSAPATDWTLANRVSGAGEALVGKLRERYAANGFPEGIEELVQVLHDAIDAYETIPF